MIKSILHEGEKIRKALKIGGLASAGGSDMEKLEREKTKNFNAWERIHAKEKDKWEADERWRKKELVSKCQP